MESLSITGTNRPTTRLRGIGAAVISLIALLTVIAWAFPASRNGIAEAISFFLFVAMLLAVVVGPFLFLIWRDQRRGLTPGLSLTPLPTAATSTDIVVVPKPQTMQAPSVDHSAAEGCGTLIGMLVTLAAIGWAVYVFALSEVPLDYRLAFGRQALDGSQFTFRIEDRIFFHDKYALVNNSPYDLKEVHLTFVTTFVGGQKSVAYRYWHQWPADSGRRLDAATTGDSLPLIERVSVYAYSDKYFFSRTFGAKE